MRVRTCKWCRYGNPKITARLHIIWVARIGLPPVSTVAECQEPAGEEA